MNLTVRGIKDVLPSKYEAIQKLVEGKPDDYVFDPNNLIDTNDYFVEVLWGKADIRCIMEELSMEATNEKVEKVFQKLRDGDLNDVVNYDQHMIDLCREDIKEACREVDRDS